MKQITDISRAEIADWLTKNENISTVYFNEVGGWSFEEREGYTELISRSEFVNTKKTNSKTTPKTDLE
mgnify:CR=1 FL=1